MNEQNEMQLFVAELFVFVELDSELIYFLVDLES